jgi:hypothetical protein
MTPSEKADFLVSQFCKYSMADGITTPKQSAKECAMIAVNEVIKWLPTPHDAMVTGHTELYWLKVKSEIEKL